MKLTSTQIATIVKRTRENITSRSNVTPISIRQQQSTMDPAIKAGTTTCISKIKIPVQKDLAKEAKILLLDAIAFLGRGNEQFPHLEFQNALEAEWLGHLPHLTTEDELRGSEKKKYQNIMEHSSKTTIFYVYGGMFFTNIPASVRPIVSSLCKLSGANAFTVRYRLAPQNPFPAALLDILIGYLSLLYPPPGSSHSPVPASRIVFAGDSAGAYLVLALTQVLLYASRNSRNLPYDGKSVPYSLPNGITLVSPYADQAHALPSWTANAEHDLMQDLTGYLRLDFPADNIWPSTPPRGHMYTDVSCLAHPLVSPATVRDWSGAPPIWMAVGEERLADSAKIVAHTANSQGVTVQFEDYQCMPHFWMAIFKKWWQSERCMKSWGEACKAFGSGNTQESRVEIVGVDGEIHRGSMSALGVMSPPDAEKLMRKKMAEMEPWLGGKLGNSHL